MSFHPEQLVVCVDDEERPYWTHTGKFSAGIDLDGLKRGTVYTIAGIYVPPAGGVCLILAEIKRQNIPVGNMGFNARRFRPITDDRLAIFRQHLTPLPREQKQPVSVP